MQHGVNARSCSSVIVFLCPVEPNNKYTMVHFIIHLTKMPTVNLHVKKKTVFTDVGPHLAASKTPFKWLFAGRPMMAQH